MFYPDFAEFSELSKKARYVPVSLEITGDLQTPIGLFMKLCQSDNCYLLESVEGGEKWARYSYIGRNPVMTIKTYDNQVFVSKNNEEKVFTGDVLNVIKEQLKEYKVPKMKHLPDFFGGAVGYIGYDMIRNFEHLPNVNYDNLQMPDSHLLVTDEVIAYDHLYQKIMIIVNAKVGYNPKTAYDNAIERIKEIQQEIKSKVAEESMSSNYNEKDLTYESNETKESFSSKVLKAKKYIENGDLFQVVLSQKFAIPTQAKPLDIYRILRSLNPSPYLFFINFGDYQLVGASPELLVKVKENHVETCPIAGTRPRGDTEIEDKRLAQELLNDEKEKAEHSMLVDLGRNDIGKVSKFGSVETLNLMHIEKYSHVMHIVSNVVGELQDKCSMYDALQACLPAGTVSGAPKVRAMEIIDELESEKRGVYAGAVGYLGFNGNMDFCITIRTILLKNETAYLQAGAGIVADSQPDNEFAETLRKARGMMEAIKRAEQVS